VLVKDTAGQNEINCGTYAELKEGSLESFWMKKLGCGNFRGINLTLTNAVTNSIYISIPIASRRLLTIPDHRIDPARNDAE